MSAHYKFLYKETSDIILLREIVTLLDCKRFKRGGFLCIEIMNYIHI